METIILSTCAARSSGTDRKRDELCGMDAPVESDEGYSPIEGQGCPGWREDRSSRIVT